MIGWDDIPDSAYGGISVGTFTHGHVGPEAIDELLRVAGPGTLFAMGSNAEAALQQTRSSVVLLRKR